MRFALAAILALVVFTVANGLDCEDREKLQRNLRCLRYMKSFVSECKRQFWQPCVPDSELQNLCCCGNGPYKSDTCGWTCEGGVDYYHMEKADMDYCEKWMKDGDEDGSAIEWMRDVK